ncbi:hypothetical protein CCR91_16710 [Thiorhodovibrio winogradskyi]|nr:hypothetical protein [Thiorhodovibrio winogradskyi]
MHATKERRIRRLRSSLATPDTIRTLQRSLYCQAKQRTLCMPRCEAHRKACAGKSHARFDEGGLVVSAMPRLFRHRQTKGAETDKPRLKCWQPALYSIHISSQTLAYH